MRRTATIGLAAAFVVLTHVPAAAVKQGVTAGDACLMAGCTVKDVGDAYWCCCKKSGGHDVDCEVLGEDPDDTFRPTVRVPGMQSNPKVKMRRPPRRPSTVR